MSNLSRWLKKHRLKNKLSTTDMAAQFKISRQAYETLEAPKRKLFSEDQLRCIFRLIDSEVEFDFGPQQYVTFESVLFGLDKKKAQSKC